MHKDRFCHIEPDLPDMDLLSRLRVEIDPHDPGHTGKMQLHIPALRHTADNGLFIQIPQVGICAVRKPQGIFDRRRSRIDAVQIEIVDLRIDVAQLQIGFLRIRDQKSPVFRLFKSRTIRDIERLLQGPGIVLSAPGYLPGGR